MATHGQTPPGMRCPRCQHENPPSLKFCGECGARFSAACVTCGASNAPTQKFCGECGAALVQAPSGDRFASPRSYTPTHLAEKILTSRTALEGERKYVTVLFADVKGSMELLGDRDPEEARKILDPVLERMMEAVHRYEGTVNQVMGDGIMALFGAPLALEDHAVRACYAALRMQETVKRYAEDVRRADGVAIQIRVGLNAGEVVVRSIGSDLKMDYSAVGQTTNLAARMEQLATPGSILVTAEGLRLAESYVEVKPLGPVNVRGIGGPIDVYEVVGAGPVRTRLQASASRGFTRFVGRDAEVEQLRQAQEQARAGHGQIVTVVGEPGVGKSRLFYEFVRSHRAHGWLVLECASASYGRTTPYLPVIELLRAYCRIEPRDDIRAVRAKVTGTLLALDRTLEDAIAPALALLDALPAGDTFLALEPAHRRQRTLGAIKRVLLRESQVQPLLLVFEDLHWIDSETQAVLDSLIEGLPSARVVLCVNYRPEYQHSWGSKTYYRQLRVDPLPPESAGELLRALVGDDRRLDQLKRLLIERTEGNPFFLEESVRTLVETSVLVGDRGNYRVARAADAIQIPASVQAILAARIDRLASEDKRLLQTAAAIGADVPFALLQAISEWPDEQLRSGLARLQNSEFIYEASLFPELAYTFKHALTHEVAYGGLLADRRRDLHARLVQAIEQLAPARLDEAIERLAYHAFRGEVWDKAVGYLQQAGRKAASRSAHREAIAAFEQGLLALQHCPETPGTTEMRVDLNLDLDFELFLIGEIRRGLEALRRAEADAHALGDQRRLGYISVRTGDRLRILGEYDEAVERLQRALHIADELGSLGLQVMAKFHRALVSYSVGDYREASTILAGNVALLQGDLIGERFGYPTPPGINSLAWLVRSQAELGNFAEAMRIGEDGLQIAERTESPWSIAQTCLAIGGALAIRGTLAEAIALLDRGLALCESREFYLPAAMTASYLAYAYALSGRLSNIPPLLARATEFALRPEFRSGQPRLLVTLGEVHLLAGQAADAARLAERTLAQSRQHRHRADEALALRLLAEIAARREPPDVIEAEARYREGLALAEELENRPVVGHCHLGLGKLYGRAGKPHQAREHLTTAATMYREMDMRFWLEKTEAELRALD
jgi:class 3 adenylate cyclase/tetratricopeptide (TPR) repeat protein